MHNQLNLLKSKRFLPLFLTQFCGAFNDNAFKNALLIWFTYDVAAKLGFDVQIMINFAAGLFILPFLLFSATAGQIADKYERSSLTQKLKIIEIILLIIGFVCFYLQNIYGLLTVLFFLGAQSTFFGPIKYSLLPEHLKDNELIAGNGLIGGGTFLSILLGTLFGGLVIRLQDGVFLLSGFLIGFAVLGWLSSCAIPKSSIGDRKLKINWHIIAEIKNILSYARKESSVWLAILGISWFWFVGVTFLTQLPHYTKTVIKGNEHIVTLFLVVFSIGIGVGSVLCNRLLKGQINGRLVPFGSLGMTIFMVDFYFASTTYTTPLIDCNFDQLCSDFIGISSFLSISANNWRIIIDLFLVAICGGIYTVPLYAIIQHRSDNRYLARIIAASNLLDSMFMLLASAFAIMLYSLNFDVIDIILMLGIINVVAFIIIRRIVRKRLKDD